jgi:ABC-2 type transport system permease protein
LVAYVQLSLSEGSLLPLAPYLAILALLSLYLLFYLALTLMLGTFFDTRGPVLGIAMVVAIGSMLSIGNLFAGFLPRIVVLLPESIPGILTFLVQGEPLPDVWPIPIILMSVYSLLFVALAIWRIKREEF